MKNQILRAINSTVLATALTTFVSMSPTISQAGPATPGVFPPQAAPYGKSYSQWSAAWWQWLLSIPLDGHPGDDSPDFDVTEGQSGHVWFLTGPFGTIEREVTIPAGTALYVALVNVESSTLEDPPFYGATAADQLAIANGFAAFITDLSFTVDGKTVGNIGDFRVTSPQFGFTAPAPQVGTGSAGVKAGGFGLHPQRRRQSDHRGRGQHQPGKLATHLDQHSIHALHQFC